MKSANVFMMAFVLWSGAAQAAPNPAIQAVMTDVDSAAPGVKPDKAVSAKLEKAAAVLEAQLNDRRLAPEDQVYAHLYHAKALYFLAINNRHFTDVDYDREDARAYRYEFEQAINLMLDQSEKNGTNWNKELAEANWQAGDMGARMGVDAFTAYDTFFPACAALGRAECKAAMAKVKK